MLIASRVDRRFSLPIKHPYGCVYESFNNACEHNGREHYFSRQCSEGYRDGCGNDWCRFGRFGSVSIVKRIGETLGA